MEKREMIPKAVPQSELMTTMEIRSVIDRLGATIPHTLVEGAPAPHLLGLYAELRSFIEIKHAIVLQSPYTHLDIDRPFTLKVTITNNAPHSTIAFGLSSGAIPTVKLQKIKMNVSNTDHTTILDPAKASPPEFDLLAGREKVFEIPMRTTDKYHSTTLPEELAKIKVYAELDQDALFHCHKEKAVSEDIETP